MSDSVTIRLARESDIETIERIFAEAKLFMRANGNMSQWTGSYPERSLIMNDITNGNCYVTEHCGEVCGVFSMFEGPDPTYAVIKNGKWLNDNRYFVIHRIAIAKHGLGIAGKCFEFGLSQNGELRIDTHRDNLPMQNALKKNGFSECGIIFLADGSERLAFQKSVNK